MDIQIRFSRSEDLERMLEIQACSLRILSPSYDSTQIESLVRSQKSIRLLSDELKVVAEYKNEIIGFASWMNSIPLINIMPQIAGIYVHPEFTRQGVGKRLLEFIEKTVISRGNEVMHVMSSMDAVNFYQAAGYRLVRESGFPSEGKVWVPCKYLVKRLVVVTKTQRVGRLIRFLKTVLKSVTSFLLIEFVYHFIAGFIVFTAIFLIKHLF
ncbi:MAG: GNAT family N-acetyltransferase [Mastigocoleus sp.]